MISPQSLTIAEVECPVWVHVRAAYRAVVNGAGCDRRAIDSDTIVESVGRQRALDICRGANTGQCSSLRDSSNGCRRCKGARPRSTHLDLDEGLKERR